MLSKWLADPDLVRYNEKVFTALNNFRQKKIELAEPRGTIVKWFLGEPRQNLVNAKNLLLNETIFALFGKFKAKATSLIPLLVEYLENDAATSYFIQKEEFTDLPGTIEKIKTDKSAHFVYLRNQLSAEFRDFIEDFSSDSEKIGQAGSILSTEFNRMMKDGTLSHDSFASEVEVHLDRRRSQRNGTKSIPFARWLLENVFKDQIKSRVPRLVDLEAENLSFLQLMQNADLLADFTVKLRQIVVFGKVYDFLIDSR